MEGTVAPAPTNLDTAIESERSLLGALLIHCGPTRPETSDLRASDFAGQYHSAIFAAIQGLTDAGEPVDMITTRAALGGTVPTAYLASLTDSCPSCANAEYYAAVVLRESRRRAYVRTLGHALSATDKPGAEADDVATEASARLSEISDGGSKADVVSMRSLMGGAIKAMEARRAAGGAVGIETGFAELDAKLCGLCPGQLIVVASRPGMGKSSLARNVAVHLAKKGTGVLFFTFEMSREEIALAALSAESRVSHHRIRTGGLLESDFPKVVEAVNTLHTDALSLVDKPGMSVRDIRSVARMRAAKGGLGLIVVDYLQLAHGEGDNREQQIASISRGLKALAKDLRVPVIALSQLNRELEKRSDKRPMLSDLRESGAIEQDADVVIFIYRDDYYHPNSKAPGVAEVAVAKARAGGLGVVELRWEAQLTLFRDMHPTQQPRREPRNVNTFGYGDEK